METNFPGQIIIKISHSGFISYQVPNLSFLLSLPTIPDKLLHDTTWSTLGSFGVIWPPLFSRFCFRTTPTSETGEGAGSDPDPCEDMLLIIAVLKAFDRFFSFTSNSPLAGLGVAWLTSLRGELDLSDFLCSSLFEHKRSFAIRYFTTIF